MDVVEEMQKYIIDPRCRGVEGERSGVHAEGAEGAGARIIDDEAPGYSGLKGAGRLWGMQERAAARKTDLHVSAVVVLGER